MSRLLAFLTEEKLQVRSSAGSQEIGIFAEGILTRDITNAVT